MKMLFEQATMMVSMPAMIIYLIGLIFILLISVVYIIRYVYDSIIEFLLLKIGSTVSKKLSILKKIPILVKWWKTTQPKEAYNRYETPFFTYYFSFSAVLLIASILHMENDIGLMLASILYVLFYFIGMARKCGGNEEYYEKVLNNNMECLKLSFLALGFIITVLGFLFTATGMNVQDFSEWLGILENFINSTYNTNMFSQTLIVTIAILFTIYVVSLPIQVLSYFAISVINYFRRYKKQYIEVVKKYFRILKKIF